MTAKQLTRISTDQSGAQNFRLSKFTIRTKLNSIVAGIILLSLSVMIYWATNFFILESRRLIQGHNLSIARLMGERIESDLRSLENDALLLLKILREPRLDKATKKKYADLFIGKNPSVIWIGSIARGSDASRVQTLALNVAPLERADLNATVLKNAASRIPELRNRALPGEIYVDNFSPELGLPVLALAFKGRAESKGEVVLIYMDSTTIIGSLSKTVQAELSEIFLINAKGSVMAHGNIKMSLSRTNMEDMPLIRYALSSPINNGSLTFTHDSKEYLGSFRLLNQAGLAVISMTEKSRAFAAVFRIQQRNIYIATIVLTLSLVIIYFFARTMTIPLQHLVGAAREIESGNYEPVISVSTRDEIGLLISAFREMARGLQEREKIKETFGKFVNPAIAERAVQQGISLGGETKNVAIFFSDLRNFTGHSEERSPHEVVEFLNEYFTAMVHCVHGTGGIVDKFIGDAIMAHWGAVESTGVEVSSAVDAALSMRKALIQLNIKNRGTTAPELHIGCGINYGQVIAGQLGSEKRLEYTVIGDAVNLASRIEYLNKHFGTDVLISEYAFHQVRGLYRFVKMPAIKIKGKKKEEIVYAVLGSRTDLEAPSNLTELRAILGIYYDMGLARRKMETGTDRLVDAEQDD